ncbi:MAG: TetR/AcrR family transcriptional regulator C-terminal domain-containing protein [Ilumatobacter fluminis]|uniref:TetR/AcrR family transcriptional regulator n=1 Tax=Ilumatobacter fluminis TaxID=467091 RepID=UPI0032ECEF63
MATPSTRETPETATISTDDRAPLSRQRILEQAIALADEGGVSAVSMRKVAAALGFEVMSLYNHVANKNDLLEGMVDEIYAELPTIPDELGWKQGVVALAVETHDLLVRHPWVAPLIPVQFPGPNRFGHAERLLELLTAGGFDDHLRDLGYHAIIIHVAGFTQQQLGYSTPDNNLADGMARFRRDVSADTFPLMVEHVRYHEQHHDHSEDRPDEFRFVLDLIVDGLERRRDA